MSEDAGTVAYELSQPDTLRVRVAGTWGVHPGMPLADDAAGHLVSPELKRVVFDAQALAGWDGGLLAYVVGVVRSAAERGLDVDTSGLPQGVRKLVEIATAVPETSGTGRGGARAPWIQRVGSSALEASRDAMGAVSFLGEAVTALFRFCTGRAQCRRSDILLFIQQCGVDALGIVTLISFLVGLILAFVGAQQLAIFGATAYTANLVGIAMARELAPIMVAIVMAGRTGAAYAAQLGTMTVNEEIDALQTFGISPMEFLVLPRMLALILMLPLLCLYADTVGIAGGGVVATTIYGIPAEQYWQQTKAAMSVNQVAVGVGKCAVFGVLVALTGCLKGIRSGRSASAVGQAATSAVVASIVLIIVTDAIFAALLGFGEMA